MIKSDNVRLILLNSLIVDTYQCRIDKSRLQLTNNFKKDFLCL